MSSNYLTVRNISPQPQTIIYNGNQIIVDAKSEAVFDETLARQLVAQRAPFLEFGDLADSAVELDNTKPATIWIANMTGDPDASEYIDVQSIWDPKLGKHASGKIQNTLYHARPVKRLFRLPEIKTVDYQGNENFIPPPPKLLEIMPYHRKEFVLDQGNWFLLRDQYQTRKGETAIIIKSRPPSEFEARRSWALDDLRAYLMLIDPRFDRAKLPKTEAQIKAAYKNSVEAEQRIVVSRNIMWKRVALRLFNPKYRIPTRLEWEEFKHGKPVSDEAINEAAAKMTSQQAAHAPA